MDHHSGPCLAALVAGARRLPHCCEAWIRELEERYAVAVEAGGDPAAVADRLWREHVAPLPGERRPR